MATQTTAAKNKVVNLREHILNVPDLEEELVYVPGWDVTVLVRALTAKERAQFIRQIVSQTPGAQVSQAAQIHWDRWWSDLVVLSARDPEDGTLLFSPTDRDALLTKNGKNLEVLAAVARRLSGLEDEALPKSQEPLEND